MYATDVKMVIIIFKACKAKLIKYNVYSIIDLLFKNYEVLRQIEILTIISLLIGTQLLLHFNTLLTYLLNLHALTHTLEIVYCPNVLWFNYSLSYIKR